MAVSENRPLWHSCRKPVHPVCSRTKLLALAVCLLVGCNFERSPEADARRNESASAKPAPAQPHAREAPGTTARRSSNRALVVEAEGLRVFTGAAARPLRFGLPQDQVLAVLENLRGPADRGIKSDCGAGSMDYAVWADGLKLHFQDGRFAGWALDQRAEGAHSTPSGTGPGSSRNELEAALQPRIEQSSLGTEFDAGGISGILQGASGEARVSDMWAGLSCVFR